MNGVPGAESVLLAIVALVACVPAMARPQDPEAWTADQKAAVAEWRAFLVGVRDASNEEIVTRFVELRPRLPRWNSWLSMVALGRRASGRVDEALELERIALDVEPLNDFLFGSMGCFLARGLQKQGRDDDAERVLLRVWRRPVGARDAHDAAGQLAALHARAGDGAGRLRWLERAARTHPERPFCALWAEWHEERGQYARAARSFAAPCLDRSDTCGLAAMAARDAYLERLGALVLRATPLPPPPPGLGGRDPSADPGWLRSLGMDYLRSLGRR